MQTPVAHSFEDHKKQLEKMIIDTLVEALEKKKLTEPELQTVSAYVLENIDKIQIHHDLVIFVDQLSKKWPIFQNIEQIEKGEESRILETEAAKTMLTLIKDGKSSEAMAYSNRVLKPRI